MSSERSVHFFFLFFIGHNLGSTCTGMDRNKPNYQIRPDYAIASLAIYGMVVNTHTYYITYIPYVCPYCYNVNVGLLGENVT